MSISELEHMPEPVRRVEIFTVAGRRRTWSPEEKAAIVAKIFVLLNPFLTDVRSEPIEG